jgi:intracellular septation protein A
VASPPDDDALPESIAIGAVLRSSGPRLVRDGFGPLAVFFVGWKLLGLGAGIALAVLFGLAVYAHSRRIGRPAMIVRVALVLVAIRATVGLTSGSGNTYLAAEIGIDALLGSVLLGSLLASRPLAGVLAGEFYPFTEEMRSSRVFAETMARITAVWAGYFLSRGLVRLLALLTLGTDSYVLVVALTDAPFLLALLAWSVYYTAGAFRASAVWGPVIVAAESPRD